MEKSNNCDPEDYNNPTVIDTFLPNLFSTGDAKHIPDKTLHERYWTSWEEQKLIELWCRYKNDIPTFDDHTPVFRTMLDEMKKLGFQLTSRDCRRRIITLRNRFFAEKKKLEAANIDPMESKWILYPLIDIVVREPAAQVNVNHEIQVVDELLTELNLAAPEYLIHKPLTIEETPEIFKNVELQKTARSAPPQSHPASQHQQNQNNQHPPQNPYSSQQPHRSEVSNIVPIRRVTPEMIKEMQNDIIGLEKNRDNELLCLRQQQDEYVKWSTIFDNTQRELERVLFMINSRVPAN